MNIQIKTLHAELFPAGAKAVTYDKCPKMKREKDCSQLGISLHFWVFVAHYSFRQKGKLKVVDETPLSLTVICYILNYIHQLVSVKDILRPESV